MRIRLPRPSLLLSSLRWRLLAATLITLVLALTFTGLTLERMFYDHVTSQARLHLKYRLDQITGRLDFDDNGRPVLGAALYADPRWERPYSDQYWQLDRIDPQGRLHAGVLRSRSLWDITLALPHDALGNGEIHTHRIIGPNGKPLLALERTVRPDNGDPSQWRVIVATDLGETEQAADRFAGLLTLSLGVLFVLLLAAAVAQVWIGLAPLRDLRRALARINGGETQQLEGRFPQEVQPLVDDFNGVLARNAEVVQRARTQAGNLAHAVKTPLAVLNQAAYDAESHPETSALGALIREQVELARRQVDWHMARSRAAAAAGLPGQAVPVARVLGGLARAMRAVHAERKLEIRLTDCPAALAFAGEEQDLQELLGNLIDNACKWATHAVTIRALAAQTGAQPTLAVIIDDDGPGIDPAVRARVLDRGVRLDESVPGAGLGLSIAAELAELYRGRLQLTEAPAGGLRATVTLPAARGAAAAT